MSNTTISKTRRKVHVISETLGVLVVVPFGLYVATRKELPASGRIAGGLLAVSTLAIDAGLLATWPRKNVK